MEFAVIIILIALLQYSAFTLKTGTSRPKLNVHAPKISGDEMWERMFRVQQNTMEQLVVFIPAIIAFAFYVSPTWVLVPGTVFIIGRQLYAMAYIKAPESRTLGFALTFFSNLFLVLASLALLVWGLL